MMLVVIFLTEPQQPCPSLLQLFLFIHFMDHTFTYLYTSCVVYFHELLYWLLLFMSTLWIFDWAFVFFSGGESDGGLREDNSNSEASDSESEDDEDEDARRDAPLSTVVKKLREIGEYREQTADRQSSSASHNSNSFNTGLGGQVEWIQSKLRRAADDRQDEGKSVTTIYRLAIQTSLNMYSGHTNLCHFYTYPGHTNLSYFNMYSGHTNLLLCTLATQISHISIRSPTMQISLISYFAKT